MVPPSPRLRRTVVVPFSSVARCDARWVVCPFLVGGGARPLATPAGLPSVGQPDAYGAGESRVPQRQKVSPRARRGFVREMSPYSSLLGRCPFGRGVWVGVRASTTALLSSIRAEGLVREKVPTWGLKCRCPSARRGWSALVRALPFPTMALPRSPWRRWLMPCLSPTAASGTPIGGVVSCFAFPQRARLGLPTPPRRARCNECASLVP